MDHRKTNFPMGNDFQNEFSRSSKLTSNKFKTLDFGSSPSRTPFDPKRTLGNYPDTTYKPIGNSVVTNIFAR
jgi:hypothetical protein